MTRTPHDHFAKAYLEELLSPIGEVRPNSPIKAETRYADLWFIPNAVDAQERAYLGLLGRLATTPCLIETFRNPAEPDELLDCIGKLISIRRALIRKAKREKRTIPEDALPYLWLLVPTASPALRKTCGATRQKPWESGIYLFSSLYRTGLVVLHQLPNTPDTLWLRMLSRGGFQQRAIQEFNQLPDGHPRKDIILELLTEWRTMLEVRQELTEDEEELIVNLSPIYQQRKQEWREEGRQEERRAVIETLLRSRFNTLDLDLTHTIDRLLNLPPDEYMAFLLTASREEIITRFSTAP